MWLLRLCLCWSCRWLCEEMSQYTVGPGGLDCSLYVCVRVKSSRYWALKFLKSTFSRWIVTTCSYLCNAVTQQPTLESLFIWQFLDSLRCLKVSSQPTKVMKFIILCTRYTSQGVHNLTHTKEESLHEKNIKHCNSIPIVISVRVCVHNACLIFFVFAQFTNKLKKGNCWSH